MEYPKTFPFKKLRTLLEHRNIIWDASKGKGSHGCFVGPDANGNIQSYPIPHKQQKQTQKCYLKGLCARFGIDPADLFASS